MIDGMLARGLKITSPRGSRLDSIGDQLTLVVALIGLCVFEWDFIVANYLVLLAALIPYAIQMGLAFWKYGKISSFHTYLAKISVIAQAAFILWLLFFGPIYWLFYAVILLGIVGILEEIILVFMYDNWVSGVKGIYWALKDKRRI